MWIYVNLLADLKTIFKVFLTPKVNITFHFLGCYGQGLFSPDRSEESPQSRPDLRPRVLLRLQNSDRPQNFHCNLVS